MIIEWDVWDGMSDVAWMGKQTTWFNNLRGPARLQSIDIPKKVFKIGNEMSWKKEHGE